MQKSVSLLSATDSRFLYQLGISALGFSPITQDRNFSARVQQGLAQRQIFAWHRRVRDVNPPRLYNYSDNSVDELQ